MTTPTTENLPLSNGEDENEGVKTFTFRNIPPKLHKKWKIVASVANQSMEEFGIAAIENYIDFFLKSQKDELLKAVGGGR